MCGSDQSGGGPAGLHAVGVGGGVTGGYFRRWAVAFTLDVCTNCLGLVGPGLGNSLRIDTWLEMSATADLIHT